MDDRATDVAGADKVPTLDPWAYQSWTRSLQRKMLGAEDVAARLVHVPQLVQAYTEASEHTALRPTDWHVFLSLATYQAIQEEAGDEDALQETMSLHEQSTHDSLDMSLYLRYASLLLHLFAARTASRPSWDELPCAVTGIDGTRANLASLTMDWTGVDTPPAVDASGLYTDTADLAPLLPSDAEACDEYLHEDVVRAKLVELYRRCAYHTTESAAVWALYRQWEDQFLQVGRCAYQTDATPERVERMREVYDARLQIPHASTSVYLPSARAHVPTVFRFCLAVLPR